MKTNQNPIINLTVFFSKMVSAVVSGLPKAKLLFKPSTKTFLQIKKKYLKSKSEKYYHRPLAKPVVEKQTLLKEKKKARTVH